mmetsp:Transcript_17516/g.28444  ORF Transcript_17516/g.28444 Transcript_17516/m.28444 type:complete len:82 (+) Transcript_17516:383-628(+)
MCSLARSNALVASSRSKICGSLMKARAIATRCFCPPDSLLPLGPTSVSKPAPFFSNMKPRLATSTLLSSISWVTSVFSLAP